MGIKKWMGSWPANCDICNTPLNRRDVFIDGRTKHGPWALMCSTCHVKFGTGLGTGNGQKYSSITLEKLNG
jgi:hypothetical protein